MYRSELTVDLAALRRNVATLLRALAGAELFAVVKADGYGHGAADVAGAALNAGATALCVATVPGVWIEWHFAQAIIHEDQPAVDGSEFRKTKRLRSEVESDQARRSGHGVKALNRNSKMPNQISNAKCNLVERLVLNG
jgi:hypothetical protein